KGVMVTQKGLSNYLQWAEKAYGMEEGEGAPVQSPLGFDLTVSSLLLPLVAGKKVVLVGEGVGGEKLGEALEGNQDFSLVKLTPGHVNMLGQRWRGEGVKGQSRALVIGGEALLGESLQWWQKHAPETRLINEYGPTETVVGCCVYEVKAGEQIRG